jgi:hypothetical protein
VTGLKKQVNRRLSRSVYFFGRYNPFKILLGPSLPQRCSPYEPTAAELIILLCMTPCEHSPFQKVSEHVD